MAVNLLEVDNLDPRVARTLQSLSGAMMGLLQEKSLARITVQDIADRAGINRATFYSHYEDKYAFFMAMIRDMFAQQLERHLSADAPFSRDNLRSLILAVCELQGGVNGHCSPADQQFLPIFEMEMQGQIQERLQAWLPDAAELQARVMSWGIFGAVNDWARASQDQSADEFANQLAQLLYANID